MSHFHTHHAPGGMGNSLAAYMHTLRQHGPAGLSYLNARVSHRFTAVFELQDGMLHNQYLFDKQGSVPKDALDSIALGDSFCQFALRDGFFITTDSLVDERLIGNKYRGTVVSYCGLPVVDSCGDLYGSLCHFDMVEQEISDEEFEFLQRAVRVLPRYLHRKTLA